VSDDEIEVARGGTDQPDATIDTDSSTFQAVLWGDRSLVDAQGAEEMRIEGDQAAVQRLVRLFSLPEPAAAGAAA
jgi:ubiquinone biosynthesis protein UbiJ